MPPDATVNASSIVATPNSAAPAPPRTAGRNSAMAIGVGFDDRHHLGGARMLAQNAHIVGDRLQIDDRFGAGAPNLGVRRRGQRSRVHSHVTAANCPRNRHGARIGR